MKVGLVGVGAWGQNIGRTLHEMGVLHAVADASADRLGQATKMFPEARAFASLEDLLRSDVEAVCIATPAEYHAEQARQCLVAGRPVFVEKPFALSADDARAVAELSDSTGVTTMVGHLLLYQPAIQAIRSNVAEGVVGEVLSLHFQRLNFGRARAKENVLWSLGVHDVAVALFLVGSKPSAVSTSSPRSLQPGIADDVMLNLEFPGGICARLHCSWLWPELRRGLTVVGTEGMLVFDEPKQLVTLHRKRIGADLKNVDEGSSVLFEGGGKPLTLEMEHFLECARSGAKPLTDPWSAYEVVRVLEEAFPLQVAR
jgi:predicted dehydrogenase